MYNYLIPILCLFILSCDQDDAIIHGCVDSQACNYNPDATLDNNSCEYQDDFYDCNGICYQEIDCLGNCGGEAIEDNCGTCDNDSTNDCTQDCSGIWGGDATVDNCGFCDNDSTNDCVQDCSGVWGGDVVVDNCGVCNGDGSTCIDCNGNFGGGASLDDCGVCDNDPTNDCIQDCNGNWGGDATEDNCGTCDNDLTNDCVQDCLGIWGGDAIMDNCGFCDNDSTNSCIQDCSGIWGGNAIKLNPNGEILLSINNPIYGIQFDIEGEDILDIDLDNIIFNDLLEYSLITIDNINFSDRIRFLILNTNGTPLFNESTILLDLYIFGENAIPEIINNLDIRLEDILISGENGAVLQFDNLNNCED